jgi:hypothetical protein
LFGGHLNEASFLVIFCQFVIIIGAFSMALTYTVGNASVGLDILINNFVAADFVFCQGQFTI